MKPADLPAFPNPGLANEGFQPTVDLTGLSTRAYFAAHAPAEVPEWFSNRAASRAPVLRSNCLSAADRQDERHRHQVALDDFHAGVYFEWRWHYADTMLQFQEETRG